MTPREIRDLADGRLTMLLAAIDARQDAYYAANGRYWQGLRTHNVVPADGVEAVPTVGAIKPDGHPSWPSAMLSGNWPVAVAVHTYQGPHGDGWELRAEVAIRDRTWARVIHRGPESWRATGWGDATPLLAEVK